MKTILARTLLGYFKFLAKIQLKKNDFLIIGVTGSVGKTSTKKAINAILQDYYKIKPSYKVNSESGIPLNILGLKNKNYTMIEWLSLAILAPIKLLSNWEKFDLYTVEMGVDSPFPPKNMGYLLSIIKPDIGVLTNARAVHSEAFDKLTNTIDPEEREKEVASLIAKEKGKLIAALPSTGAAILNYDDTNIRNLAQKTAAKVLYFGKDKNSTVRVISCKASLAGTKFELSYQQQTLEFTLEGVVLPDYFGENLAAALAVAISLDIPIHKASKSLQKNFKPPRSRSSLIPGINNSYIIDSSYNASAESTVGALKLLQEVAPAKKMALLGDMRELGQETKISHERVAKVAAEVCDKVVLIGPEMKSHALPIIEASKTPVFWFADHNLALIYLEKQLEKDTLLLVKGSQNTLLLESIVERLMLHPEDAEKLLCRRGKFWDKKRAELLK